MKYFIENAPLMTQFIVRTLYANVNRQDAMGLVNMLPHASLQKAVRAVTSNAFFFNQDNPTDRYSLKLDNPTDRNVAQQVFALAQWEKYCVGALHSISISISILCGFHPGSQTRTRNHASPTIAQENPRGA